MDYEKRKLGMCGNVIMSKLYTIYKTTSLISCMWHQEYHGNLRVAEIRLSKWGNSKHLEYKFVI